jgi:hypothetical protein
VVPVSQDIRRERELRERTIDGFQAMLRDERDRARETAARLEEENALLLWLLAEAVWKLQLESAKSWAREQAGKPYEGWNVLRRRRVEQHSVWVMGACTCGAKCDGAAGWKQHQYEVGAWVPQKGERVTGKSRGKYDPDPVGEFDSFSYEGTTAIINHVPPRYPAAVSDRTYVDADSIRPAPTEPTRPRVWHKGDPEPKFVASVRDVHGDVWTRDHTGVWRTPETAPCGWGYMANKWAPLTEVVERDPAVVDLSLTRSQELERDAADMETHGGES